MHPSTKPWLMFKEKIMEIQCRDHTREYQNVFYYWGIWLNNILDVHVLHYCEYWNTTEWVECIQGGDNPRAPTETSKQTSKQEFNGWWWMCDNGYKTTGTWFSRLKDSDSSACFVFFYSDDVSLILMYFWSLPLRQVSLLICEHCTRNSLCFQGRSAYTNTFSNNNHSL